MEYASTIENKIARRLITAILKAGLSVSVYDGGEWCLRHSKSKKAIMVAMCSTSHDVLSARDKTGERIGTITLIWGNDDEVISDHTDNDTIRKFVCYAEGRPFSRD